MNARWPALACLALLIAAADATPASAQDLPPGRVIEKVACAGDAGQSYALYLPSSYSRDRRWPILYAFDPRARGAVPVERYSAAAERYGYIVVGSNNSRNGPFAVSDASLRAMLTDTASRFSIDAARAYFTGFSGGARVAVLAGLALGARAAGVIGSGAGFPTGVAPSAQVGFAYFATVGVEDFNYPEMTELDQALDKLGVVHRLQVFEGGHEWPPAEVCARALEWMEIQAMRRKVRPTDERLLDEIMAAASAEAANQEKAGRLYWAYTRYLALAADLAGLRDVAPFEQKARQLEATRQARQTAGDLSRSVGLQRAAEASLMRLVEQAMSDDDDGSAVFQLLSAAGTLKSQSERPANDATRMASRRALATTWSFMNDAAARDVEAGNLSRAAARLRLMARIRPEEARVDYSLARVLARAGDRKGALQALGSAARKGFSDRAAIEADSAFDRLREDEAFKKIVGTLPK